MPNWKDVFKPICFTICRILQFCNIHGFFLLNKNPLNFLFPINQSRFSTMKIRIKITNLRDFCICGFLVCVMLLKKKNLIYLHTQRSLKNNKTSRFSYARIPEKKVARVKKMCTKRNETD